jgi:predicted nucleotidyltransferase
MRRPKDSGNNHATDDDRIRKAIAGFFAGRPEIRLCFLYGSAASGRLHAGSDVDVAVAAADPLKPEELAELQLRLSELLGREVDLVDLRRAEGLLLRQILARGLRLKNEDPLFLSSLIRKMWYFEADMMPNIRLILQRRAERFAGGA